MASEAASNRRAWLWPALSVLLAVLIACRRTIFGMLRYDHYRFTDVSAYNIAVLTPNYIDNGFIRRGLGGTILYVLEGGSAAHGGATAALYQLIGALVLAVPMALLLRRLARSGDTLWRWYAAFMLLSPQLFWGWSREPGRSDMLISGIVAWSVIAMLGGRFVAAALLLYLGSLVHETAVIFGAPMLLGLWFIAWQQGRARLGQGAAALALLALLLVLTALAQQRFGDDVTGVAATVRGARLVAADARLFDVATYLTWGGFVSIGTSLCMALSDRTTPLIILSCFIVFILNCRLLFDRAPMVKLLLGVAALVPMIFMSVIAIDHGRWLMFATASAWLAVVAARLMHVDTSQPGRRERRHAMLLLGALVLLGPASAHYPSFVLEKAIPRLVPGNNPRWLADCTPDWQATLGPPESAPTP